MMISKQANERRVAKEVEGVLLTFG